MINCKERIEGLLSDVTRGIYEKETDVALALLAALAGESIIMLGLPGTAKSMVARRLKSCFMDARGFEYLMSRFSTPDEIFGPVSITMLKTSDKYERVTDGYLPTADVVFLDEIWKAGPAIQNTLLTVINEKVFRNGDREIRLPLKLLVAASNELPTKGEGLEALWDRFVIRLESCSIRLEQNFKKMLLDDDKYSSDVTARNPISQEEYAEWKNEISKVHIPDNVFHVIFSIRRALQAVRIDNDEHRSVYVSDRRWKNIARLLKTSAFVHDRCEVEKTDMLFLHHCLWQEPEERNPIRDIVVRCVFDEESSKIADIKGRMADDIRRHRTNPLFRGACDYSLEIDHLADRISNMERTVNGNIFVSPEERKIITGYLKEMYKALAFMRQDMMKLED